MSFFLSICFFEVIFDLEKYDEILTPPPPPAPLLLSPSSSLLLLLLLLDPCFVCAHDMGIIEHNYSYVNLQHALNKCEKEEQRKRKEKECKKYWARLLCVRDHEWIPYD